MNWFQIIFWVTFNLPKLIRLVRELSGAMKDLSQDKRNMVKFLLGSYIRQNDKVAVEALLRGVARRDFQA